MHISRPRIKLAAYFAACALAALSLLVAVPAAYADDAPLTSGSQVATGTSAPAPAEAPIVNTGKGDLAPGTYYLSSAFSTAQVLDVFKGKKKNGGNALVNPVTGKAHQRWIVEIDAKGYALLKNAKTGLYLSISGKKAAKGVNVVQSKKKSASNLGQRWIVKKKGSRYAVLSAKNTKLALQVIGKKTSNGLNVNLQKHTDGKRQLFAFNASTPTAAAPGTQTVADGTYLIRTGLSKNRYITIADASKKKGANAQLASGSNTPDQAFEVAYDGQGYYTVTNVNSKKKLAPGAYCGVPGINVGQYTPKRADLAKWRIDKSAAGYQLVNKATGLALDVEGSKTAEGTNVRTWKAKAGKSQEFLFVNRTAAKIKVTGTYYIAMGSSAKKVLDVKGGDRTEDANVEIDKRADTNLQRYKIASAGNGLYYLQNVATKRVISLAPDRKKSSGNVTMRDKTGEDDQKWSISFNEDFTVSFTNAATKFKLTVKDGKTAKGTNVEARKKGKATAQSFQLVKTKKARETVRIGVPCYMQNPQLPTGCESVALTNALRYWGFSLSKTTIANSYMPYGSDGVYNFIGNPRDSSGWIICAPGIANTADKFLASRGSSITATALKGKSLSSLKKYLDRGNPVVVWTTIGMGNPGAVQLYKHGYPLRSNNHAVVLTGYNPRTGQYQVSDSLAGIVWRSGSRFTSLYNQMGKQAVVLSD